MIVMRLNTGNIKFRQRRPRRDTFVDYEKIYFTIKWKCRELAERKPWAEVWGHLMHFSSCPSSEGWGPTWSMSSAAKWCTEWHWQAKENEQEFPFQLSSTKGKAAKTSNSKLRMQGSRKYSLGKMTRQEKLLGSPLRTAPNLLCLKIYSMFLSCCI